MKNFTTKMMIAAAAMTIVAGAASAQVMKADVPFAFRTGAKVMEAGPYEVSINRTAGVVAIRNWTHGDSAFLLASARLDGGKAGDAKLVFSCKEGDCTLVQAWTGNPAAAYAFPHAKDRNSDATLYEIRLHK
jgi:hypothetical protein